MLNLSNPKISLQTIPRIASTIVIDLAPEVSPLLPEVVAPQLTFQQGQRPSLIPFIQELLDQATVFVDDILPTTFHESGSKSSSPSSAKVKLLKREITSHDLSRIPWKTSKIPRAVSKDVQSSAETWVARRSRHANQIEEGTASFSEFDHGLRVEHSEHEREYTPDVFDSFKVLDWDTETVGVLFDKYSEVRMSSK